MPNNTSVAHAIFLLLGASTGAHAMAADAVTDATDASDAPHVAPSSDTVPMPSVSVTAKRLDQTRNGLSPDTGSTVYRITGDDIAALPQGADTPLNKVLLQAPGVANDSYGQLHVRGDHADLQYRINGVIIPEAISGFGQSLDTRIVDQVNLLTGALPAQYGYRTAGIIDITTKSGEDGSGGSVSVFGGSHQTLKTSADVYGTQGAFSYFLTGSLGENNLGIESPTAASDPLHDHTRQGDAFGYLAYVIDPKTRVSLLFGSTSNQFQLPDTPGLTPTYTLNGRTDFDSSTLNDNQSELNNFAAVSLQGSVGEALDYQVSVFTRYTRTQYTPDTAGDLMFNGVASNDFHNDTANGLQTDITYRLNARHTLRAGMLFQQEHATFDDTVSVFPTDANGNQLSDQPFTIHDDSGKTGYFWSAYVQEEWRVTDRLTLNYGLRYDGMAQYVNASQISPRIGAVFKLTPTTTVHAGYSRYFTPPSFELVSGSTIDRFAGTTNASEVTQDDPVKPERSDYYDIGISQKLSSAVTVGVDGYYKHATNLLDEGQFGTALIYTPFNYAKGRVYGIEFTANYHRHDLSAYLNLAFSRAQGEGVDSAQFNFGQDELNFISNHWVFLDHDQRVTASFGGAYTLHRTTFSIDGTVGSGLRNDFANTGKLPLYASFNLGVKQAFDEPVVGKFSVSVSLENAFGRTYELRDGSGIGVGAPQYGPYRAIYAGVTKAF